jgi:hypothetical protein
MLHAPFENAHPTTIGFGANLAQPLFYHAM